MKLLMIRLAIGYPGWLALNYSVTYISVGLAQTLQNLIPFLVLIISYVALKETLHWLEIVNMLVAFSGVLFIIGMSTTHTNS
jgi:drug/metabolite transporter (DMT)-like permease